MQQQSVATNSAVPCSTVLFSGGPHPAVLVPSLSDILQKLQKQQRPSKFELRQMAKALCVPQWKDGKSIDVATLEENIRQAVATLEQKYPTSFSAVSGISA